MLMMSVASPAVAQHAGAPKQADMPVAKPQPWHGEPLSYKLIPATVAGTWGYDIYAGKKLLIHQPNVPGRAGNAGFALQEDAAKVAGLVVAKMQQGVMPPSVNEAELSKLNITANR